MVVFSINAVKPSNAPGRRSHNSVRTGPGKTTLHRSGANSTDVSFARVTKAARSKTSQYHERRGHVSDWDEHTREGSCPTGMRTNIVGATGKRDTPAFPQQLVLLYSPDGSIRGPVAHVLILADFDEIDVRDRSEMDVVAGRKDEMVELPLYLLDEELGHAGFDAWDTLCSPAEVDGVPRNARRVAAFAETHFGFVDVSLGGAGDDD